MALLLRQAEKRNFARPHSAVQECYPRTLAMAAGVADHIWSLEGIAALLD